MLLIAKKKIRYPKRGPDAKEYMPGDTFDTLTDRDAKALLITRVAEEQPKRNPPKRTLTLKPPAAIETTAAAPTDTKDLPTGTYGRRDMRAAD